MRENRQIVARWRQGGGSVLATLVRVQGSSYRRPGAHLLICKDGSSEGGISAGCLEADLLRKASWLIRDGAVVKTYSTLFEESADMPFGLGCGGVLDVLLEPVDTPECQALLKAIADTLLGHEYFVATWHPHDGQPLKRAIVRADGEAVFSSESLSSSCLSEARLAAFHKLDQRPEGVSFDHLVPPQRLFIFGAGDDAKPLAASAVLLGWSVTVVDGRTHLARRDRFPNTDIRIADNAEAAIQEIGRRDAVIIMTHSFVQDAEYLAATLPLKPQYLGLLGARQRSALLLAEAAAKSGISVTECCERVAAPAGLDIGAEGPEEIALAILAEAQAYCAGKRNEFRKLSPDLIARYVADPGALPAYSAQCGLDWI